ncbi:uncharacterized protein LOC135501694 [Lineus longissimus]|uniref:uncharacterized protein LOC135501694 n=1 Tax=Lineus longissimus TaxID=88925 RepID=UPI00315CEA87
MNRATTKVRIVFDASAKTNGTSLNDNICQGPKLQRNLVDVLQRLRRNPVALVCDISQMYLQIGLAPEDRPYHRFLWRGEDKEEPNEYEFNRVVFGVNASPFLAQFVSQEHARKYKSQYPLASETVLKSTYMDDSMDSVQDDKSGIELYKQLNKLWGIAGMDARKYLSNSPKVLAEIPMEDRASQISLDGGELPSVKTLGVMWKAEEDIFTFEPKPVEDDFKLTKRNFLRKIAAVFDPLGFIAPYVMQGRIVLQKVWVAGYNWDDAILGEAADDANNWFEGLLQVEIVKVPRCLRLESAKKMINAQLHTFVDASQDAYGCCIFLRTEYEDRTVAVRLVASKGKVAPLIALSIPRLELMAAIAGLRLTVTVSSTLEISIKEVVFWSDSMNVLWWIRGRSRKFKPFVANRVGEIQGITSPEQWRHVPTYVNPADLVSRGMGIQDLLASKIWWSGPAFLQQGTSEWPENKVDDRNIAIVELEVKKTERTHVTTNEDTSEQPIEENSVLRLEPSHFSSWMQLCRRQAWVRRFIDNCRKSNKDRQIGELSPEEIERSGDVIISKAQQDTFAEECKALRRHCLSHSLISSRPQIIQ